jgi:hypothetical protein
MMILRATDTASSLYNMRAFSTTTLSSMPTARRPLPVRAQGLPNTTSSTYPVQGEIIGEIIVISDIILK